MPGSPRIGAGCLFSRPDVFASRTAMLDQGEIGHVQLLMMPCSEQKFQEQIEIFETYSGKIRIHAPHHMHAMNPCDPDLYAEGVPGDVRAHIEQLISQSCEAADRTGSDLIVLHAGRYKPGQREKAVGVFHEFLDLYRDTRFILENLPDLQPGYPYLGTNPGELETLGNGIISGYCLDFPHLWCSSLSQKIPYDQYLTRMQDFPVRFSHLSGSPGPDEERQHLLFDDPDNLFNPDLIRSFLQHFPDLEISLEFAVDDPAVIRTQLGILSTL